MVTIKTSFDKKTSVSITLLVVSLLLSSFAKLSAQDTLTPAQIREDFNYMMEQYERIHPNPTWSLGGVRYNELKQQTLAQLDHPMTQLDFWRIIARWNQYFDGHTTTASGKTHTVRLMKMSDIFSR